jgi:tetratricopeptide (TPR) repeat protein
MQIESRFLRVGFVAASIVGAVLYVRLTLQPFRAAHAAAVPSRERLERAVQLEPSNAEYHDRLGLNLMYAGDDPQAAVPELNAAVNLNPYAARYWVDLANAYLVTGRTSEQRESLERAVLAEPTTPDVAWQAANFFLLQGDQEKALHNFRVVLANDPGKVAQAIELCWRAAGDPNLVLDQALPPRSDLYFSFLNLLMQNQNPAAAETVWNRLVALKQPFSIQLAFPYIRFLLLQRKVPAAQNAWQQLASISPTLAPYLPTRTNLIVNAGFEQKILDGGFDWLYRPNPNVVLTIDTRDFHSGSRSLSIAFDGQNPPNAGIFQFIPVKPNTDYAFSAAYRTEDILTASGPRFSVTDAYTGAFYVLTDDFLGTHSWQLQQAQFRTGPGTVLLLLSVTRQPGSPLIRGKMWIDDFELVEK